MKNCQHALRLLAQFVFCLSFGILLLQTDRYIVYMYNVSADIVDVVIAVVTSESEREKAIHKKRVKKSNWQLTWQQTNDKRLSVCLSLHGSVPLSDCVHSICRVRFRFRVRISNEFRRNFKNCKLKEEDRKRWGREREMGAEEIGKLYNNLAREKFCCSMSLANCCRTKLSGQVQVQLTEYQKSISKIHWTMPFVVCVCRCLSTFIFGKCRYKLRQ